jgi:hypothetical protein
VHSTVESRSGKQATWYNGKKELQAKLLVSKKRENKSYYILVFKLFLMNRYRCFQPKEREKTKGAAKSVNQ